MSMGVEAACNVWESPFPLRLICIQGTLDSKGGILFNAAPSSWNFHTISHTWSKDLRSFSEYVADGLEMKRSAGGGGITDYNESVKMYNEAFEREDFSGQKSYCDLREFLELLWKADGVDQVWFDALCINQRDDEEKNREIGRMTPYYRDSLGTYVLPHGVGQGYHMWPPSLTGDNTPCPPPRWFTRVWTLQEYVLPKQVTFLAETETVSNNDEFILNVQLYSRMDAKARSFECMFHMEMPSPTHAWSSWCHRRMLERPTGTDNMQIVEGQLQCLQCERSCILRRANANVYFLDSQAYYIFMVAKMSLLRHWSSLTDIRQLFELRDSAHVNPPRTLEKLRPTLRQVFDGIRGRQCSHEEDRVLGILGMLGLPEDHVMPPIRVGLSLEQQVRRLSSSLPKEIVLHFLVYSGLNESPFPNMSWSPTFLPWDTSTTYFPTWGGFTPLVHVDHVSLDGRLHLSGPIAQGRLLPHEYHNKVPLLPNHLSFLGAGFPPSYLTCLCGHTHTLKEIHHMEHAPCQECLILAFSDKQVSRHGYHAAKCYHLEIQNSLSIPLEATYFTILEKLYIKSKFLTPTLCRECLFVQIPLPKNGRAFEEQLSTFHEANTKKWNICHKPKAKCFAPIDVSILLLGSSVDGGKKVITICIGSINELHRIGYGELSKEVSDAIFSGLDVMTSYAIGSLKVDSLIHMFESIVE